MKYAPRLINPTKVQTGKVRLSFANLFEPRAAKEGEDLKYSVDLLIPKDDKENLATIEQAIENAKQQGLEKKWNNKLPSNYGQPLKDGDDKDNDDAGVYAGHFFINAKSGADEQPTLLDRDKEPVTDGKEIYSGCYARAILRFYPYKVSGNNGVSCILDGVQKLEDGTALGGRGNVAQEFDEIEDDEDFLN